MNEKLKRNIYFCEEENEKGKHENEHYLQIYTNIKYRIIQFNLTINTILLNKYIHTYYDSTFYYLIMCLKENHIAKKSLILKKSR